MKKLLLSALAAAFVFGIGASTFAPTHAFAAEKATVDCSKPENATNEACKKKVDCTKAENANNPICKKK